MNPFEKALASVIREAVQKMPDDALIDMVRDRLSAGLFGVALPAPASSPRLRPARGQITARGPRKPIPRVSAPAFVRRFEPRPPPVAAPPVAVPPAPRPVERADAARDAGPPAGAPGESAAPSVRAAPVKRDNELRPGIIKRVRAAVASEGRLDASAPQSPVNQSGA